MKVVIFGASGFIGTHFRDYLKGQENIERLLFDISPKEGISRLDVRKAISIESNFSSKDVIINLAAVHTTPGHPDYQYFETNIRGAENVCDFAERVGINNIIFTSSIAPYGASEEEKTEETLPTPNTPYGISKLGAEYVHKEWAAKSSDRKLMILRPGVVFGKGEQGNFTRLASAISKGIFFYPGRKNTIKGCIYVKELVHQSWTLFGNQKDQIEILNFAYYPSYTIEGISNNISSVLGKKQPKLKVPAWTLQVIARLLWIFGLSRLGIHPDRVKKLMISTNISGEKLRKAIKGYKYSFQEALEDWYQDCNRQGLF